MTSAAVSRLIKEELLNSAYPEYYSGRSSRPLLRVAPKSIRKIKKSEPEVKIEIKKTDRKRRNLGNINLDSEDDDDVEVVRALAPRRPYQWKGRKVKKVLRPGTVVQFSPGMRSGPALKRNFDEVFADTDILEQADQRLGEFAYGKRSRLEALVLDDRNSTPSLRPVTAQVPLPIAGKKREAGELQPTVQVMVPAKRRRNHNVYPGYVPPTQPIKDEDMPDVGPSSLFFDNIPPVPPSPTKMDIEEIKIRPVKKVTSDIGIQTVDIQVPVSEAVQTEISKNIPKIPQGVRYHPSIVLGPKVVRKRRRRRRTASRRVWKTPATTPSGVPLPRVQYHPTIIQ